MNPQAKAQGGKVSKVMHEFGSGKLRSSSGQKVTNPKQAVAIALSEQRRGKGMQAGGLTDDQKAAKYREEWKKMTSPDAPVPPAERAKRTSPPPPAPPVVSKARGGALEARINRQDTRHGKIDMPFTKLTKFAGMRKGGSVKRFNGEENSYVDGRPFAETEATEERTTTRRVDGESSDSAKSKSSGSEDFKRAFAKAMADSKESGAKSFEYKGKSYALQYAKPSKDMGDESERVRGRAPRIETVTETVRTPAVTGRADKASKNMPSDEQKAENTSRFAKGVGAALSMVPVGRVISAGANALKAGRAAKDAAELSKMGKANEARFNASRAAERDAEELSKMGKANEARFNARRAAERAAEGKGEGFRKGGIMKYRAGGKVKEAQMEERHASAMKKAGLPKSMVREEQAEAKKYARGGGIESRGKTKGTVVRMAKGGSVRGGGCEVRGKTKGRMV